MRATTLLLTALTVLSSAPTHSIELDVELTTGARLEQGDMTIGSELASGESTTTVSGHVTYDDGQPAEGARVVAVMTHPTPDGQMSWRPETVADAQGAYSIAEELPAPDGTSLTVEITANAPNGNSVTIAPDDLSAGGTYTGLDIIAPGGPPSPTGESTTTVSGHVTYEDGQPAEGVTISVLTTVLAAAGSGRDTEAVTDVEGRYTGVVDLPIGEGAELVVVVSALDGPSDPSGASDVLAQSPPLSMTAGRTRADVDLVIPAEAPQTPPQEQATRESRTGTLTVIVETAPPSHEGTFGFIGVPVGVTTTPTGGDLVAADLKAGTYTTTSDCWSAGSGCDGWWDEVVASGRSSLGFPWAGDGFDLASIECDDLGSATPSTGDLARNTAVFNLDPGESVICTFLYEATEEDDEERSMGSGGGGDAQRTNPFEDPDPTMEDLPLPDDVPPDAGTYDVPREGPWSVMHLQGQLSCQGAMGGMPMPPIGPELGEIEVQADGSLRGGRVADGQALPVALQPSPAIRGRYEGVMELVQQGVPMSVRIVWQLVTDEFIVSLLTGTVSAQGITCEVHRPGELRFAGEGR